MSLVLLGQIGSGKTTLYNKITRSNEKTNSGGQSVTQNVFMKKSCYGEGFKVLDTPGFGSNSKKIEQIGSVLCALAEGPINKIAIIAKFDRTDLIMNQVKTILPAFMNYRHMITVIVTFWDYCNKSEKEKNKKDIEQILEKFEIKDVIFVGKNDDSQNICQQIDQIIAKSQAQNVQLTDNEIYKNFDLIEYDDAQIEEINSISAQCVQQYHKFFVQAIKKIQNHNIKPGLLSDFLNAITSFAKQKVNETMQQFETQKLSTIDNLSENDQFKAFQIHFQLKSTLVNEYNYIVTTAQEKLSNGNDFFKYIKKCYFCGEIWLKVDGCEGQTICGSMVDNHKDKFIEKEEPPKKFNVTYFNEKLEIQPNDQRQQAIVLNEQNKKNLKTNEERVRIKNKKFLFIFQKAKLSGLGCGREINWEKMEPLKDEELTEVLGILDKKLKEEMCELEKQKKERALIIQKAYKNELEEKIKDQKNKIQKAA